MKKYTNDNNSNFLKEGFMSNISKRHKEYLGTTVPEGYFAKSKDSIIDKVKLETIKEKKQVVFWLRPNLKYMTAASLVLIFGLTVWLQNANQKKNMTKTNFEMLSFSEDNLINSLLVDDSEFDAFADATLMNEIVIKAELSERKTDDFF